MIHLNLALVLSLISTLAPMNKGLYNRGLNACSYGTNT